MTQGGETTLSTTGGAFMQLRAIEGQAGHITQSAEALAFVTETLAMFARGNEDALFALGVAFSTGSRGCAPDLVEAHKWFNIAAARGHDEAAHCRADVADEMTAREIAEAQRRARQWLQQTARKAA